MDKEKNSPSPGRNLFENAANLIGVSPFGLSYASHLAHLPGAYSFMGHHPAFPVTSLFGGLGADSPFGQIASSMTSSAGAIDSDTHSISSSPTPRDSPKSSKSSHKSSPKSNVTKGGSMATSTTTTSSNKRPKSATVVAGSTGISLLSGKQRKNSNKMLDKMYSTSLNMKNSCNSVNGLSSKSSKSSSSSFVSASSSSPLGIPVSKHVNSKFVENGLNLSESDHHSDDVTGSLTASSDDEVAANGISDRDRRKRQTIRETLLELGNGSLDLDDKPSSPTPAIHIDGMKKKLIADQIRQRVQNKTIQNVKPSIMQPMKRGRGRPPKNNAEFEPTQQQLDVIREYKKQQEELKRQLESNLKHQQMQLKMMKRAQADKEKEASIKVQRLLEDSVKQAKASSHKHQGKHRHTETSSSSPSEPVQSTSKSSQQSESSRTSQSEPHVAKFKTLSEESSELSDSDMESMDSDSGSGGSGSDSGEPQLKIAMDSDAEAAAKNSPNHKSVTKRSATNEGSEGNESTPCKRPRVQMDEKELQIPMNKGWKRQTTINAIGKRGFIGEVLYFAPCGKKLKTIPDVMRYIDRHGITGMGRENFSFNTKVNVGRFFEGKSEDNDVRELSQPEVAERMALVESKRQKMLRFRQQRGRKRQEKQNKQLQLAKQMMEQKLKRKLEQQEMARRAAEYKLQKKSEKDRQQEMVNKIKQLKAYEQKKQKEQLNLIREQEKIQRQEQMRVEREMRAQQILESNLLWYHMEREREMKRQQAVMIKEQERERKRQHLLLVKALEAQKKQAERDRLKEEKINEKRIIRERKMEQKRLELQMARELKKPTEDMELLDSRPLPEYPRIPALQIDSTAFADILMVLEFLHNFADALGYDKDTLPTLKSLQDGILSKTEDDTEDYVALVSHLLRYAVNDPGVSNPKEALTRLGQKIADVDITDSVVSEILRVFIIARNGKQNEMSEWLTEQSIESFSHVKKASILAFLCNELLCGKAINAEIDKQLDRMGDIRRDKWVVEGRLRRLRIVQAKKFHSSVPKPSQEEDTMSQNVSISSKKGSDDEEKEDESGNESSEDGGCHEIEGEEEEPISLEDCEKQIEKLQKTHAQYRAKVFKASHKLRGINFGQDRYKRRYWTLPCAGGVYVEGLETGRSFEDEEESEIKPKKSIKLENSVKEEEKQVVKQENEEEVVKKEKGDVKMEVDSDVKGNDDVDNKVKVEIKTEAVSPAEVKKEDVPEGDCKTEEKPSLELPNSSISTSEKDDEKSSVKTEETPAKGGDSDVKSETPSCNGETVHNSCISEDKKSDETSSQNSVVLSPSKPVTGDINTTEGNIFLQNLSSAKLSDFSNISLLSSNSLTPSDKDKCDVSKSVVNSDIINTSPSTLITPYSAAPSIFIPSSFSPSMNGSLCIPSSSPLPAHQHPKSSTPSGVESKSSFLSIDTLLKKDSTPSPVVTTSASSVIQSNHFLQTPLFPVLPLSPDQMLKTFQDISGEQKPWFSILPRIPCDDLSMTQGSSQVTGLPNMFGTASPFFSPLPLRAFPLHSPTFASFQMGQIYGSSSEFVSNSNNTSKVTSQGSDESSFKVPSTPKTESDFSMSMSNSMFDQTDPNMWLKDLQGEIQEIPQEMKEGWWKITDPEHVRQIQRVCHPRGIREKNLQKTIQKFFEYAIESCSKGDKEVISLESDEDEEDKPGDEEEEEEKKDENSEETKKEEDESEADEKKEEKENKPKSKKEQKVVEHKSWLPEVAHQIELGVLNEVENLVERVATASLQVKGWNVPSRVHDDNEIVLVDRTKTDLAENEHYPLDLARGKLLHLEPNIERRYLKPPLCKAVQINLASLTSNDCRDNASRRNSISREEEEEEEAMESDVVERPEDIPPGLATWRRAVATATSPAQLTLCVYQLTNSISWEKSIMKVLCQICRKDDNEAELLLCDGCDQGYHTYCFKPKMENIPEGDWYCYECIGKATGDPTCIVCGKKTGKIAECYHCPRAIHLDCLDPPLPRMPRKWVCPACSLNQNGKKRQRKSPKKKTPEGSTPGGRERRDSDVSTTPSMKSADTPVSEKKRGKDAEKKRNAEQSNDMTLCRLILTEMEKHEDGWPFLKPVNFKQFPTYKRYIKQPMDFLTIKNKIRDSVYKTRSEFACDTKLIFDNCKTFNEDDSEVGQAGHSMRKFFENRWKELLCKDSSSSSSSSNSTTTSSSSTPVKSSSSSLSSSSSTDPVSSAASSSESSATTSSQSSEQS